MKEVRESREPGARWARDGVADGMCDGRHQIIQSLVDYGTNFFSSAMEIHCQVIN